MPRVPYQPYPTEAPTEAATPGLSVNVSGAMFGENVGRALEHLGGVTAKAGDELWNRAVALKQLENESEAKEADAKFMMQVGKLHGEYSALQGKAAVDAFPKYQQDIDTLRQTTRKDLSNDQSRKMFDSSALSTQSRTIFNGAGHAAQQNKVYINGASEARVDAIKEQIFQTPDDQGAVDQGLAAIDREVRGTQAGLHGWSPEQTDEKVGKDKSSLMMLRIVGTARNDPFRAKEMLEANRGLLREADFQHTEQKVQAQLYGAGSRSISDKVNQPGSDDSLQTRVDNAVEMATQTAPEDPVFKGYVEQRVISDYNKQKAIKKDTTDQYNQTLWDAVGKGGIANIDQLRASSDQADQAFQALEPKEQAQWAKRINQYNAASTKEYNDSKMTELKGMRYSDPTNFLSIDPTDPKLGLNQQNIQKIIGWQNEAKKQPSQDPRVAQAVGVMRNAFGPQMEALGIFRRTQDNKENYDYFMGALQSQMEIWMEDHKKQPTQKQVLEEIAPPLFLQHRTSGWLSNLSGGRITLGDSKDTVFTDREPPQEFKDDMRTRVVEKGGTEPTDEELKQAWIRAQLIKNYEQKKAQSGGK